MGISNRNKFEIIIDRLILRGGKWEKLEQAADINRRSLKLRKTKRDYPSIIKGHFKHRLQKDKN